MRALTLCLVAVGIGLSSTPAAAQSRPDFSGVWRLDATQSRMIGGTEAGSENSLTWLVDHRDPRISVVVNLRDERGSHEWSFRCTTDGTECVNELADLGETRRTRAVWEEDSVLVMTQTATTPHGEFSTTDRVWLSGGRLIFDRIISNERGDRSVRQVFRKLGPHPSQRAPEPLPSVQLPPQLDGVLRDYERHWRSGNADSLTALFTADGFVARRGGWIRGEAGLRNALQGTSSDLRLRPVAYAIDGGVGYIIGNYGYGTDDGVPDRGMFILTLKRDTEGRWRITADLDGAIRNQ